MRRVPVVAESQRRHKVLLLIVGTVTSNNMAFSVTKGCILLDMENSSKGNKLCCIHTLRIFVHQRTPAPIPKHDMEIQHSYNPFMPDIATSNKVKKFESVDACSCP